MVSVPHLAAPGAPWNPNFRAIRGIRSAILECTEKTLPLNGIAQDRRDAEGHLYEFISLAIAGILDDEATIET